MKSLLNNKQKQYIKLNYTKYDTIRNLTFDFNKMFNTDFTRNQIKSQFGSLGIIKNGKNGRNGGLPIGTERIYKKTNGTYDIYVKVNNIEHSTKTMNNRENWKLKKLVIWENYNGKLPSNYRIVLKDGNYKNLTIDNMVAVPKEVYPRLNVFSKLGNVSLFEARYETYMALYEISKYKH